MLRVGNFETLEPSPGLELPPLMGDGARPPQQHRVLWALASVSTKEGQTGTRTVLQRTAPQTERRRRLRGPKGEAGLLVEALGVQSRHDALGKAGWPQGWGAGRRLQMEQGLPGIWGEAQVRSEENGYLLHAQTVVKSLP